jgi:hypothetical protein
MLNHMLGSMKVGARVLLVALACAAACVRDTDDDDVTVSANGSGPATTTGAIVCDTMQPGNFNISVAPCGDCAFCASQARCADEAAKCPAVGGQDSDPMIPCDVFFDCIGVCFDMHDTNGNGVIDASEGAAFDECTGSFQGSEPGTCVGDNPDGADHYLGLLSCIVCQECQINCDAATNCM